MGRIISLSLRENAETNKHDQGRTTNMRLFKKATAVAMASVMALSLAACGGGAKEETTTAAATEAAKEETTAAKEEATEAAKEDATKAAEAAGTADFADKKVGISIYKFDDNFMTLYRNELQRYLTEELGFKAENVVIQDGKGDQAEQTNQIQNFITQKFDVLILNLVQASSAPEITDMCKEAGIPVVYINREPDVAEEERWASESIAATYVGCDARQSGTFQGEEILATENKGDINGDGKVSYIMIQGDPENVDAQYRTEFSIKALTDAGMEVEELLKQRGDWDQAKAQQIAQDALTQHGDKIEVIFCNNDAMALGALQSIEAAGRKVNEDIYLVGVDALVEAVQNVIDGKQTGTVFNDHFSQAKAAADAAVSFLKGEAVDTVIPVDYIKVTAENAQEILDKIK
jgi:methyl-galactoside transport system substrate-binding protein